MTMTDLDVLTKVQKLFGGSLYIAGRRNGKDHWKDAWRWSLHLEGSIPLIEEMLPFLGERRAIRANFCLNQYRTAVEERTKKDLQIKQMRIEVKDLAKSGRYNHTELGKMYGVARSYISHIVAGKYDS